MIHNMICAPACIIVEYFTATDPTLTARGYAFSEQSER